MTMKALIASLSGYLREKGPCTGAELRDATAEESYPLWRACRKSDCFHCEIVGRRYLRLDRRVDGYGRLSPSIKREFLTYTVIGLKESLFAVREKAGQLRADAGKISRKKLKLSREKIAELVEHLDIRDAIRRNVCFIIAGDIVYDMGHNVPRPEKSTGKLVNGSDLDIIVVYDKRFLKRDADILDEAIYKTKYRLLIDPELREEIDYIIKDMDRIQEQLQFDNFRHMVACKLLHEGKSLYGSRPLFNQIKTLLSQHEIPEKLRRIEEKAVRDRKKAEEYLLSCAEGISEREYQSLFYTADEADEIF